MKKTKGVPLRFGRFWDFWSADQSWGARHFIGLVWNRPLLSEHYWRAFTLQNERRRRIFLRFQSATKGILSYKTSAAGEIFCGFRALLRGFYLTKWAPQAKFLRFHNSCWKNLRPRKSHNSYWRLNSRAQISRLVTGSKLAAKRPLKGGGYLTWIPR